MIKKEFISYQDGRQQLEGFLAYPLKGRRPLVILCHAWKGRDDFIIAKTEKIAALGYAGFAIDLYGKGIIGNSNEENAQLKRPFLEDRSYLKNRLLIGYETALSQPCVDAANVAVLGFGFGAIAALDLARAGVPLKGAISVYGHFDLPCWEVKPIQAKILILHGYNDPIAKKEELFAFQEDLAKAGVNWQTHLYGNAVHAFATPSANNSKLGICYNTEAAKHAWQEIENFLPSIFSKD